MTPLHLPRLPSCLRLAAAALIAALAFAAPARALADTYNIVALTSDNRFFDGISDTGLVVFDNNPSSPTDFYSFLNGISQSISSTAPSFTPDDGVVPCNVPPCSASDNGRTVTASSVVGTPIDDLFFSSGSNPPQLITTVEGISGFLAINGTGDVVFDSGTQDEWYEAVDLTAVTPEPSSILLLATGLLALGTTLLYRRQQSQS